jgi:hypothetical protein
MNNPDKVYTTYEHKKKSSEMLDRNEIVLIRIKYKNNYAAH